MVKNKDLPALTNKWAKKVGRRIAMSRLLGRDVAVGTVEKLCTGRYFSTPRERLADILVDEMSKDGFLPSGEKAS